MNHVILMARIIIQREKGDILKEYHIITFGCQMNEYDAESMAGALEQLGYGYTDSLESADIILINTCCVRETAENKVYGLLGRLKKLKDRKPNLIIGVGGCMTQQKETAFKMKQRFPQVDLIFGTHSLHELPRIIQELLDAKASRVVVHHAGHQGVYENLPVKRMPGIKAWVPVAYGCDNFCTYCIVPYVRGRERSRRPEDIVREVQELVAKGYQEVTLLGQNVNSYGKQWPETNFADLLSRVNAVDGLKRIRFMTSHPKDFTDDIIEAMVSFKKVCEHIHLPIQAGSNQILKRMNRGYTREYYLQLVDKIRFKLPDVSLTTDVMVGFPGETEEDFLDTLSLLQKVGFDSAYTFVYNVRQGTPAATMPAQVTAEVKSKRIQMLVQLQNTIALANNQKEIGKIHEMMIDGHSKTDTTMASGRSRTNKLIIVSDKGYREGELVQVQVTEAALTHLKGKVLQ